MKGNKLEYNIAKGEDACRYGKVLVFINDPRRGAMYNHVGADGELLSDEWWDLAGYFKEGFALVRRTNEGWNWIGLDGKFISKTWKYVAWDFKEGAALFGSKGEDGYRYNHIRDDGKIVSDTWWRSAFSFNGGYASVQREDRLWNLIDRNGTLISDEWWLSCSGFLNDLNEYCVVRRVDGLWNIIDKNAEPMMDQWYEIMRFSNGEIRVRRADGLWNVFVGKNKFKYAEWQMERENYPLVPYVL